MHTLTFDGKIKTRRKPKQPLYKRLLFNHNDEGKQDWRHKHDMKLNKSIFQCISQFSECGSLTVLFRVKRLTEGSCVDWRQVQVP